MFPRHVDHHLLVAPLRGDKHESVLPQVIPHPLDQLLLHLRLGADVTAYLQEDLRARREGVHALVPRTGRQHKRVLSHPQRIELHLGRQEPFESGGESLEGPATKSCTPLWQIPRELRFRLSLEKIGNKVEPHPFRHVAVVSCLDDSAEP